MLRLSGYNYFFIGRNHPDLGAARFGADAAFVASVLVGLRVEQNAEHFRVRVRDEGPGFDWTKTADPRADENLFLSSGRGIFFMKHFVDHVAFQCSRGKGTEVVLEKRLEMAEGQDRGNGELKGRKG